MLNCGTAQCILSEDSCTTYWRESKVWVWNKVMKTYHHPSFDLTRAQSGNSSSDTKVYLTVSRSFFTLQWLNGVTWVWCSLQPHHPHPQMSWCGCKKKPFKLWEMWKLEHHDRPIQSLTADDNLWLSTVTKPEWWGEIFPREFPHFHSKRSRLSLQRKICLLIPLEMNHSAII